MYGSVCATMEFLRNIGGIRTFLTFSRLNVCAAIMSDYGGTVAAASSRRLRITRLLDHNGACATMDRLNCKFAKLEGTVESLSPIKILEREVGKVGQVPIFIAFAQGWKLANLASVVRGSPDPAQVSDRRSPLLFHQCRLASMSVPKLFTFQKFPSRQSL